MGTTIYILEKTKREWAKSVIIVFFWGRLLISSSARPNPQTTKTSVVVGPKPIKRWADCNGGGTQRHYTGHLSRIYILNHILVYFYKF